jgi:tripartite-type tricarboxylate transporter receptor subunit TctC
MRWNKAAALLISALAGGAAFSPLQAQDYPTRNVTLVLPLAAGTGLDTIARLYGEKLSESLGRPVIIENRPGANMVMATQSVVTAAADGHTLLIATPTQLSTNPTLYKNLTYNPEKNIVPISHYLMSVFVLVVNPSHPVNSVQEFVKYAKERATPLTYSSPAGGGMPHYAVEWMKHRLAVPATHVPYKDSPQSIRDIAAGHIDFAFVEAGSSRPLIDAGKLRALAVSAKQRLPAFPDLPSFAEASGVSDFDVVAWHMLVANAETPRPIVDRLNSKMKEIMSNPDIQRRISNMGLIPVDPPSIADTEQFLKAEALKWRHILTEIGLAGSL